MGGKASRKCQDTFNHLGKTERRMVYKLRMVYICRQMTVGVRVDYASHGIHLLTPGGL